MDTLLIVLASFAYLIFGLWVVGEIFQHNGWKMDTSRPVHSITRFLAVWLGWLPYVVYDFAKYRYFTPLVLGLFFMATAANAQTSGEIKYPNGVNYWESCSGPAKHSSATLYSTAAVTVKGNTSFVITAFSADMDVLATTKLEGATVAVCGGMLKVTDRDGFVYMLYGKAKPE